MIFIGYGEYVASLANLLTMHAAPHAFVVLCPGAPPACTAPPGRVRFVPCASKKYSEVAENILDAIYSVERIYSPLALGVTAVVDLSSEQGTWPAKIANSLNVPWSLAHPSIRVCSGFHPWRRLSELSCAVIICLPPDPQDAALALTVAPLDGEVGLVSLHVARHQVPQQCLQQCRRYLGNRAIVIASATAAAAVRGTATTIVVDQRLSDAMVVLGRNGDYLRAQALKQAAVAVRAFEAGKMDE